MSARGSEKRRLAKAAAAAKKKKKKVFFDSTYEPARDYVVAAFAISVNLDQEVLACLLALARWCLVFIRGCCWRCCCLGRAGVPSSPSTQSIQAVPHSISLALVCCCCWVSDKAAILFAFSGLSSSLFPVFPRSSSGSHRKKATCLARYRDLLWDTVIYCGLAQTTTDLSTAYYLTQQHTFSSLLFLFCSAGCLFEGARTHLRQSGRTAQTLQDNYAKLR